jgi:diadenylate cyclase
VHNPLPYIGFLELNWIDLLDIALVSLLLYNFYKLIRGTMAFRVFLGFLFLYIIYLLVQATHMELLAAVLGQFMGVGVLFASILFQQELKKFFLMLGETPQFDGWAMFGWLKKKKTATELNITPILDAMKELGSTNTGALLVVSIYSDLVAYVETGDVLDAVISKRLLISIFNKYSPLHDGALLIINGKIRAARCILPVTENLNIPASMGLRHRAAIGMSEATNTLILVVSEETGQLSVARNGEVYHNLSLQQIKTKIQEYLNENENK